MDHERRSSSRLGSLPEPVFRPLCREARTNDLQVWIQAHFEASGRYDKALTMT
jgi:hypothetical protein